MTDAEPYALRLMPGLRDQLAASWTGFLDANPDDLTSPEELPDHALVTCDQMIGVVEDAFLALAAAPAVQPAAGREESDLCKVEKAITAQPGVKPAVANGTINVRQIARAVLAAPAPAQQGEAEPWPVSVQRRVDAWMQDCFGAEISADKVERADRFVEEALELVQAVGYDAERAHALVDYVFGREVGDPSQEVGGVMVTLAALCNTFGLDIQTAADTEIARITQPDIVLKIRAKQAAKPTGSALPIAHPPAQASESGGEARGCAISLLEAAAEIEQARNLIAESIGLVTEGYDDADRFLKRGRAFLARAAQMDGEG